MTWVDYYSILKLIGGRYFFVAGIAFFLFYVLLRNKPFFKKIQPKKLQARDYRREIGFSILTIFIFALVPFIMLGYEPITRRTMFYESIAQYGNLYFVLAFPLTLLIHDTYFYWMHRTIHHKKLFRLFHLLHHKSTNPSPWAAYAFHPLEALLEIGIVPLLLITIPLHIAHLLWFFSFMIVYNVYIHLGYELYPKNFQKHWLGKWLNTSVAHNNHHQLFTGNYSLYFTFWDRWMGTLRTDYHQRYTEATAVPSPPAKAARCPKGRCEPASSNVLETNRSPGKRVHTRP